MSRRKKKPDPFAGLLLMDKPPSWTSHDVVAKLRNHFKLQKVGHAGTLDPMATGLLILLIGRATKRSAEIMQGDKTYSGTILLGRTTSTQDIEGDVLQENDASEITRQQIDAITPQFRGSIKQLPPMVSAIKKDGVALYKMARKGIEIEREARPVEIHTFDITAYNAPYIHFNVICSKGTYVRTLAHDMGAALECGGCLHALRREASGSYCVSNAHTLETLLQQSRESLLDYLTEPEVVSQ
jgi:tRNA pseudouridine55 synthase